jgi:hypothetical protein
VHGAALSGGIAKCEATNAMLAAIIVLSSNLSTLTGVVMEWIATHPMTKKRRR